MYFTKPDRARVKIVEFFEKDGKKMVRLLENPFYPDGSGGQLGDRGRIGDAVVLGVYPDAVEIDRQIGNGEELDAFFDKERREEIARQHTAQHILSAAIEDLYGAKTVGFHMGEETSTIDLDSEGPLEKAEVLSNDIVMADMPVEEIVTDRENAERYPLRKDLSEKAVESAGIRIIKIGNFDINACGGFHVSRTGEVGIVKILRTERVKGGLVRAWFVAGKRAFSDYSMKTREILDASKFFDASWTDLSERIAKAIEESKERNSAVKKLSERLAEYISRDIKQGDIIEADESVSSFITRKRQDTDYALRHASSGNVSLCSVSRSKEEVMEFARKLGAKGGGRGPVYRFSFENFEEFETEWKKFVPGEQGG